MPFTYQWIEHHVSDNRCTRCGLELLGAGEVCLRVNLENGIVDSTYSGTLPWSVPCTGRA